MKEYNFILIFIFLTSNILHSQDAKETKKDYEKDTLQGRHFGNFIKPVVGINFIEKENKETTYFKKCEYLKTNDERKKCFSDIFYGVLREKLSYNGELLKKMEIDLVVKFTINKFGIIENFIFVKSNDPTGEFEKEIIRVLKKLPKIVPAKVNGEFVDSTYKFPINFKY
jgi:hypothetical protein